MTRPILFACIFFTFVPRFAAAQADQTAIDELPSLGAAGYLPLKANQKLARATRRTFSPESFVFAGLTATYSQATNEYRQFGQGAQGYGKRYGASFADQSFSEMLAGGVFPVLFKQDPRYFRSSRTGLWRRTAYAVSRTVITRRDAGGSTFNSSLVAGSFTAAAIGAAYYPEQERNLPITLQRGGFTIAAYAGNNILVEFGPELKRWCRRLFRLGQ